MKRRRFAARYWIYGGFLVFALAALGRVSALDWRAASHEPVGLAPDPRAISEPLVQVYAARAFGWRGLFGVHTWIAVKPAGAKAYTVYEVIGWRLRYGNSAVAVREREPDARWFGSEPELIAERRGAGVEELIARIDRTARAYPWADEYSMWPGPNSNTFTAWVTRAVPELGADLPPTAIGKDYVGGTLLAPSASGAGYQISVYGLAGIAASRVEGLEINLLGLTFGLNPFDPAIKLPILGRLGAARAMASSTTPQNP